LQLEFIRHSPSVLIRAQNPTEAIKMCMRSSSFCLSLTSKQLLEVHFFYACRERSTRVRWTIKAFSETIVTKKLNFMQILQQQPLKSGVRDSQTLALAINDRYQ